MGFTRDELAAYEKAPQKQIDDTVSPFRGATPAAVADPAAVAAVTAGQNLDATPGGTPQGDAAPVVDDSPVVDEEGSATGDPTVSGEGTSDEPPASSPGTVDPGNEADPNADLTGTAGEEPVAPAPAKGSAQERIVELNDRLEGAMVFGKGMQEMLKEQIKENERLRAASGTATAVPAPVPVVEEDPGPMPSMSDPDVVFDDDKYREKMAKWVKANGRAEARAMFQQLTGATEVQRLEADVNAKVEAYIKEDPEFIDVVTKNPVLKANQLAPEAGNAVARSPYTAEILMKFGRDLPFAIRVAKMPVAQQLVVIGEMIAEVKAEKKAAGTKPANPAPPKNGNPAPGGGAKPAPRKSISQAPPPPRPTPAAGRTQFNPLDPSTSMDDFVRDHRKGKQSAREANRQARGLK